MPMRFRQAATANLTAYVHDLDTIRRSSIPPPSTAPPRPPSHNAPTALSTLPHQLLSHIAPMELVAPPSRLPPLRRLPQFPYNTLTALSARLFPPMPHLARMFPLGVTLLPPLPPHRTVMAQLCILTSTRYQGLWPHLPPSPRFPRILPPSPRRPGLRTPRPPSPRLNLHPRRSLCKLLPTRILHKLRQCPPIRPLLKR